MKRHWAQNAERGAGEHQVRHASCWPQPPAKERPRLRAASAPPRAAEAPPHPRTPLQQTTPPNGPPISISAPPPGPASGAPRARAALPAVKFPPGCAGLGALQTPLPLSGQGSDGRLRAQVNDPRGAGPGGTGSGSARPRGCASAGAQPNAPRFVAELAAWRASTAPAVATSPPAHAPSLTFAKPSSSGLRGEGGPWEHVLGP